MKSSHQRLQLEFPAPAAHYCPHLGLMEDLQTCVGFPSSWNICHHCRPVSTVQLVHQRHVCLTTDYQACPVFQSEEGTRMPLQLRDRTWRQARLTLRGH